MALTKMQFYLSTLLIVIIVFTTVGIVGTDISNHARIDINEKSVDYILEVKGMNEGSGYEGISETESAESQTTEVLDSEDDKLVSDNNDFLSTLYIKKERAASPTSFFKVAYNLPTTLLTGLGLNPAPFRHIINIFSYVLALSIVIMVWVFFIRT